MKKKEPTSIGKMKQTADALLRVIKEGDDRIKYLMTDYEEDKRRLDEHYAAEIASIEFTRGGAVKQLTALMKENKDDLFQDTEQVYLANGTLIHSITHPVAFPRSHDALIETLKTLGFKDVIKTKESLDKDAIEKWDDDLLASAGLARKELEEFKYDLKKDTE